MDVLKKEYSINGSVLKLEKVKVIQLEMFADIIGDIDFGDKGTGLQDIIRVIRKQGFDKFMEVAFYPEDVSHIKWSEVDYEIVDEVIEDFFVLNPRLKKRALEVLNDFLPKLVGLLTAFSKDTPSN